LRRPSIENNYFRRYDLPRRNGSNLTALVVCTGFIASAVAFLLGTVCAAVGFVTGAHSMHTAGTVLLIAMIPLLILAGCCLDLMDRQRRREQETAREQVATERRPELLLVKSAMHGRRLGAMAIGVFGLALLFGSSVRAQQTIFNVPSTDVLPKGKVYFELDVPFKPNNDPNNLVGHFSSFVPRIVVGAGSRIEVGLNVTGNIQPGADATTLVPAVKYKAYDGADNGWAIVAGDHLYVPVRNKAYNLGNYVYLEASKTFKTNTRITFGGYHFSDNVVAPNAQRAGGQFGFEQTVNSKFSVVADWYTGKHAAGYFTPGITFKPHPKVTGYFGYSIGNTGASRGNHYFLAEIGINFN
jgi:hypothetical protein